MIQLMKSSNKRTAVRTDFEQPSPFWPAFVRQYWNKRPVHLRKPFKQPFTTVEQLFEGIVRISNAFRSGATHFPVRFYVGDMDKLHFLDLLPVTDDRSLEGYVDRIRAQLHNQPFGLVINDYHDGDERTWRRARDFLRGLFDSVGMPGGQVSVDIFLGAYDVTPFGLHKDFKHVFTWIIKGRKRILTWPFETFSELPGVPPSALTKQVIVRSADYHDYFTSRDSAFVLEGTAGDLLYWPPSHWHVAESVDGRAPVTITIGIDDFADPMTEIQTMIQQHPGSFDTVRGCWFPLTMSGAAKLPQAYSQKVKSIKALFESDTVVAQLRAAWLSRITGLGLSRIPPIDDPSTPIFGDDILVGNPKYPIRWVIEAHNLVYSANGWAWTVPNAPGLLKLFRSLNRGVPARACELQRKFDPIIGEANLRITLENLIRCRWLESRAAA
jgi:hypothetical protein